MKTAADFAELYWHVRFSWQAMHAVGNEEGMKMCDEKAKRIKEILSKIPVMEDEEWYTL